MTTATATAPTNAQRLDDLLRLIGEGRLIEAFERHYAPDVTMAENEQPPTVGFAANLARERAFIAGIASVQEFTVLGRGVGGDRTFYESLFRWTGTDGVPHRMRQVAIARWRDGRIVDERFVYDTATTA